MWYKKKPKEKLDKLPIPNGVKVHKKINYKDKLDRVFSLYIRLRDSTSSGYFRCISCGQIKPFSQADAGHYFSRRHNSTRFDEDNVHAECSYCNRFDSEHLDGFRENLISKIGQKRFDLLRVKANSNKQFSDFEYQVLIKHYTELINKLKHEKGV